MAQRQLLCGVLYVQWLLLKLLQGKVVVIGAGPAGLGAAHQLKKLGAEVS